MERDRAAVRVHPAATSSVEPPLEVEPIHVDILQMELDQKLPHWLDPSQRYFNKHEAARKKNRERYLAEQKAKRKGSKQMSAWQRARAESIRLLGRAFDPDEPRDEEGKWTDGGGDGGGGGGKDKPEGGGKDHPGPGYSASAFVKDGVIHTTSVYDAQRALHENRKVELDQPRKVSILLHRLGDEAKAMIAKGKEAPNLNLCNVTVSGTNLFCADTKGIPRVEMPQLDKQQTKDFQKYLKEQGYKIEKDKVHASHLRATQNELNGVKVAAGADKIIANDGKVKPIIVSKDDYILDGHHAWAAKVGLDAADNKLDEHTKMDVRRVNISITKLLHEAEKFTGGKGHKPASESKSAGQILADLIIERLDLEGARAPKESQAMPIPKPKKDEEQSAFMERCMHEASKNEDRTNDQNVAICLGAWREAHPGAAKPPAKTGTTGKNGDDDNIEVPDPDDGETENDFMDRCVDALMDANENLNDDDAEDRCQMAWDNRKAPANVQRSAAGMTTFKTHAAEVHGMEFVLSDESVDRLGDIVSAGGWDIKDFRKNPIALFNHRADWPIGTWSNLRVEDGALKGKLNPAPEGTSPRIDEIRRLIDAGILRAVSVGFRALDTQPRKSAEGHYLGEHFTKQELIETSLVSVPANPNALAIAKSLRVSADTLDMVFAEPGADRTRTERASRLHRRARQTSPNGKSTQMSLSQRIVDLQNHQLAKRDKLAELLKEVDDTNPTEAQIAGINELNEQIKRGDETLASLKEAEKSLATRAASDDGGGGDRGGNGGDPPTAVVTRREVDGSINVRHLFGLPPAKKVVPPHEHVIRSAVCLMFAHRYHKSMSDARAVIYPKDEATKAFVDYIEKTASAPAMTTVAGWAQELAQTIYADFMALLMPNSVYPRLAAKGLALSFGRAGRIIIPTRNRTPTIAGSFVGEGQPIPVRQGQFTSQTLVPKKLGIITVYTREMDEHSIPAIEGLLRQAVQEDTAVSLDSVLLDTNPATAVRPAGLFNGITPITPATGGGFTALVADMKALTAAILQLTQGHIRMPVWLMNMTQVNSIKLTPNPLGAFPFRDEIQAGNLLGFPVIDSGTVPVGTVGMVDAADFVTVGGEAPRFEISDQAVLHLDDTTPLPIVDGGTPAAPVRSLWQTDSLGLRMIWPLNYLMRRPIVAVINGVTW
jgi:HK97 family phage prohead protease